MQVTVETTAGLERRLKVAIPEERVQGEVDKRLANMTRSVRIPGFRPGKVPRKVVAQRFGRQVRDEVIGEIVQSSFYDALVQERLQPAGAPTIDPVEANPGQGVAYTAVFDVYPDITVPDVSALRIARPRAVVEDSDVDGMIETLRKQRTTWSEVDRPATEGDRAVVDFDGTVDGEVLEQASAREQPVELGLGRMIPGFESGIVGAGAGDERTLELSFPDDYRVSDVAGKAVTFHIKVHRIEEPALPEVDDEFASSYGVKEGGAEGLRSEIRANMERELADAVRSTTKRRAMDALLETVTVELPASLVQQETDRVLQQRQAEFAQMGIDPANAPLEPEMFEGEARRRVSLGLLLAEIIKTQEIKVDADRVRARIESVASTYDQADEVVSWYYADRERLSDVESSVLEDQVVDWVLEEATLSDELTSFDALLNPGQTAASARE